MIFLYGYMALRYAESFLHMGMTAGDAKPSLKHYNVYVFNADNI